MSQILQKLHDVDPNDSDAVKEVITSFFQNLPKHREVNCNIWLRVLEDVITRRYAYMTRCMTVDEANKVCKDCTISHSKVSMYYHSKKFPRYCSQHRSTIENYLAHFLDSSNYYNVVDAAKCAHGLQQIRPSQDKTATPKNCWREQMNILCNTAHTLIEAVFTKTVNIYKNSQNVKIKDGVLLAKTPLTLALSRILNERKSQSSSGEEKKMVLCNKLRNIFVFIQAMLVEVYPVAKPIQPQLILEVIVQALSVSSSVNTDVIEASTVKIQALKTLDALIACLGPNFIPFSALVFRSVMQTLRWSSDNPSEESRKVRVAAYNSLNKWLNTLHVHRVSSDNRGRSWEDELTKHIIDDITPTRKIVQLTMSTQHTKNLSKKAKRKLANSMLQQSTIASHMPGEKNKTNVSEETSDEVANAALECAETFLTVCGIFLKPTTHKLFQERLVRECYNLDLYNDERSLSLLRTLDAERKNTPSTVPPPTQYCVQLYSSLVNSRCDEIRKFCSQALLDIRLHLHCSPPTINFALEAQPENNKVKEKKREISEKNRAALELLLGTPDRVPPKKDQAEDETDTVEEPSNKRPRLEEDTSTRISISSESENSVVISDDSEDEVQEIVEDNADNEADEEEMVVLPEQESVDSNTQTSKDNEQTEIITDSVEDKENTVDTTETVQDKEETECNIPNEAVTIYEAKTQVPLNTSTDTVEGDKSPISMEIAYDVPNTESKVTVLEKMDDENLPSTNDTDDVQITCGQVAINSQEAGPKENVDVAVEISTVQSNGINELNDEVVENDDLNQIESSEIQASDNIEVKITSQEVTVEDMMADFVDEVNEEPSLVS